MDWVGESVCASEGDVVSGLEWLGWVGQDG